MFVIFLNNYIMVSLSSLPIQIKHSNNYLFGNDCFHVEIEGDKFLVRPRSYDPYVLGEIYSEKVYKTKTGTKSDTVLDLGAYIGDFSVWAATHLKAKKIVAVEMDEENFKLLSQNIKSNTLGKKIHAINAAISSKNGKIGELENKINHGMHRIDHSHSGKTKSMTLEKIMGLSNLKKIDIIKMDIEGAEKDVFNEANKKIFAKNVGCVIMETHPSLLSEKLITLYLSELGFSVSIRRQAFRRGGILTAYNNRYE